MCHSRSLHHLSFAILPTIVFVVVINFKILTKLHFITTVKWGVGDWGWGLLGWCEETTNTLIAGKFENHSSSIDFFKLTFVYAGTSFGTICFSSTIVTE